MPTQELTECNIMYYPVRYRDRDIVCDYCFCRLTNQNHYYEIHRASDGYRMNPYPFHSTECATNWIRREIRNVVINPPEPYDLQEEETE